MTGNEGAIYLLTCFDSAGSETERLVSADSRSKAVQHVVRSNKASAEDVMRVMEAGGRVEKAE